MPYYPPNQDKKELDHIRRTNQCAVCGGNVSVWFDSDKSKCFIACSDWLRTHHEGIAREALDLEYNIETRRDILTQEHGQDKAVELRQFDLASVFTKREDARKALAVLFPNAEGASPAEFEKAIGLCLDYGADPRLGEVFMIPYKVDMLDAQGKAVGKKTIYETVRGIRFTRKVTRRKHKFSYLDDTPRLMTEAEEKRYYKTPDPERVRYITKIKDLQTGEDATGRGEWPMFRTWTDRQGTHKVPNNPKGMDKGNSMENMAAIHSERNAYDLLYPTDLPQNVRVFDENTVDAQFRVVEEPKANAPAALADGALGAAPGAPASGLSAPTPNESLTTDDQRPPGSETDPLAEWYEDGAPDEPPDGLASDATSAPPIVEAQTAQEEKRKVIDEARELINDRVIVLRNKKDLAGKELWPNARIRAEIAKILTISEFKAKLEDIPDDKVSAVAHHLDELTMA